MQNPDELIVKADKELKKFIWPWSIEDKYENAIKYYEMAAKNYRFLKEYENSGDAFIKCASNSKESQLHYYVEASISYKKGNKEYKYLSTVNIIIDIALSGADFLTLGRIYKDIAEYYNENKDYNFSIEYYKKWLNIVDINKENIYTKRNILQKIIELSIKIQDYNQAIKYLNDIISIDTIKKQTFINILILCSSMIDIILTKQIIDEKNYDSRFINHFLYWLDDTVNHDYDELYNMLTDDLEKELLTIIHINHKNSDIPDFC